MHLKNYLRLPAKHSPYSCQNPVTNRMSPDRGWNVCKSQKCTQKHLWVLCTWVERTDAKYVFASLWRQDCFWKLLSVALHGFCVLSEPPSIMQLHPQLLCGVCCLMFGLEDPEKDAAEMWGGAVQRHQRRVKSCLASQTWVHQTRLGF